MGPGIDRGIAMAEAMKRRRWAKRLTWAAAVLSFGSVLAALVAAVGSGQDLWHFRPAFTVLRWAFFAACAGALLAIVAALIAWRASPKLVLLNLLALIVALGFVLYLGLLVQKARSVPAIHDISTNLEDYPRFYRLRVRDDNLADVPDMGRPELAAMSPRDRWRAIHREHYGDIATVRVPWDVAGTTTRARDLAEERGWEIATFDPEAGIVEAVDTSRFFRFRDNVIVRVREAEGGAGSIVDMRSISRVGVSDVGVNAERVRAFLADLQREQAG